MLRALFNVRVRGQPIQVRVRPQINPGKRVMLPRLRRIAVALTAALTLAAASVPTNAEARGFFVGPGWGGWDRGAWVGGGPGWGGGWGGGGWGNVGWGGGGCCVPPPPPPPPPCCCCGGWNGGGWNGGGWDGGGW
jgi:hypothetical protein